MNRRLLSLLLSLLLLLSAAPLPARAEEETIPEQEGALAAEEPAFPLPEEEAQTEPEDKNDSEETDDGEETDGGEEPAEPEPAPDPVSVSFVLSPEEATVQVYTAGEEPALQTPDEQGVYWLLPGEYVYTAEAENYVSLDAVSFTVLEGEAQEIRVELEEVDDNLYIQPENFPDAAFRSYLIDHLPVDIHQTKGYYLTPEAAAQVEVLDCSELDIESLEGLSFFPHLKELRCDGNRLTELDISAQEDLQILSCAFNQLAALDVSGQEALTYLNGQGNRLTALDASGHGALTELIVSQNQIRTLDISGCDALERLLCADNRINELNVGELPLLEELICDNNWLPALDLSANEALLTVSCAGQTIPRGLLVPEKKQTPIDEPEEDEEAEDPVEEEPVEEEPEEPVEEEPVEEEPDIYTLYLLPLLPDGGKVSMEAEGVSFDAQTGVVTFTLLLEELPYAYDVGWHGLTMDVTVRLQLTVPYVWLDETTFPDRAFRNYLLGNISYFANENGPFLTEEQTAAVTALQCPGRGIESVEGIACFSQLQALDVGTYSVSTTTYANDLASLDLSHNPLLRELSCSGNPFTELDLSANTRLESLVCTDGRLERLDLSANTKLQSLACGNNRITELNVAACAALVYLSCENNQIESLNLRKLVNLERLFCNDNCLTGLDVSACTLLQVLGAADNQIVELSLGRIHGIRALSLSNNPLSGLQLAELYYLGELHCDGCGLASLDVRKNDHLVYLHCNDNSLSALDVSKAKGLRLLACQDNWLTALDLSNCPNLQQLNCSNNALASLDVSKNAALVALLCSNNQIAELDVSQNAALQTLYCGSNRLCRLSVAQNGDTLLSLRCAGNHLTELNLRDNAAMIELSCLNQTLLGQSFLFREEEGDYVFDLSPYVEELSFVKGLPQMDENGLVVFSQPVDSFSYEYDTGFSSMEVTVWFARTILIPDGSLLAGDEVEVDGVPYVVGEGEIRLPAEGTAGVITKITYQQAEDVHGQYPTGLQVWLVEEQNGQLTARRAQALDDVLQYAGSSIRISGNKGIRMITSVPKEVKARLIKGGVLGCTLLEYGTLLQWDSELADQPLTLELPGVKSNYAYKKGCGDPVYQELADLVQYTNVMVGFTEEQCVPDIAMRPYMRLLNSRGEIITIYGGVVHRSIGYIAYQNRHAFPVNTSSYTYIWALIHAAYGDAYDNEPAEEEPVEEPVEEPADPAEEE